MLPSLTSVTGSSGFLSALSSESTSVILLADACEIVSMTKTIENIMRLMRIIIA